MDALRAAALVLAAACAAPAPEERAAPADSALVITGGRIYTGTGATVEALCLRDGRVVFAGEGRSALAAAGPHPHVLDLAGATVVPGLVDAHGHVLGLGAPLENVDLGGTKSFDEVIERVAARAATLPAGAWITGRGWDQTRWSTTVFPHHAALSRAVPDHPVLVTRVDGHAALANARALELAGLSGVLDPPPAVEGGRVHLDGEGRATGVLVDTAIGLVSRFVPAPDDATLRRRALRAQEQLLAEGLTAVHDMGVTPRELGIFRELEREGLWKLRLHSYLWGNEGLDAPEVEALARDRGDGRVRVAGVKLMIDGALGSRGAALLAPYADAPGESGLLRMEPAELTALVERAARLGLQPAVHAIGDRGNRVVLDAFEAAAASVPGFAALRPRVEHAQVVAPEDWSRFAALGAIPSMQPRHATSDMRWAEARLGPERLPGAYAWRRLDAPNAPLALGSDFPVEPSAPLLGLYAARTRQDEQGAPPHGFLPDQRLSGAEALEGFTRGAAFAVREERERGRLLPGFCADLTVLGVDPVAAPAPLLLSARVLLTMIDGEVVFDARRTP